MAKPKPKPPNSNAAEEAVETAEAAVEELTEANEDDYAELLATARARLENAEKEIRWLKDQIEKTGTESTRINSTLESLSLANKDLKEQLAEIVTKFQQLIQPPSEPAKSKEPPAETPAIQTATKPEEPAQPPAESLEAIKGSNAVLEPPAKKRRFI